MSSSAPYTPETPTIPSITDAGVILERNGVCACAIGDIVTMYFGSNLVLSHLHLAVADAELNSAHEILCAQGFHDIPLTSALSRKFPANGGPTDWSGFLLLRPPIEIPVMLSPASYWQLDISPDSTYLAPNSPLRLPHFVVYLEALIEMLSAREGGKNKTISILYQFSVMLGLLEQRPALCERIKPENRFFIEFYQKQVSASGMRKIVKLRESIRHGAMTEEMARSKAPRPDLRLPSAKQRVKSEMGVARNNPNDSHASEGAAGKVN